MKMNNQPHKGITKMKDIEYDEALEASLTNVIIKQLLRTGYGVVGSEYYNDHKEYFEKNFDFKEVRKEEIVKEMWVFLNINTDEVFGSVVEVPSDPLSVFRKMYKPVKKHFAELYQIKEIEKTKLYDVEKFKETKTNRIQQTGKVKFTFTFNVYVPNFINEQIFNGLIEIKDTFDDNHLYNRVDVIELYNKWQESNEKDRIQLPFSYWYDLHPDEALVIDAIEDRKFQQFGIKAIKKIS